jgi:hypothetical protein
MFHNYQVLNGLSLDGGFGVLFALLVIWSLAWKAWAFWRAARNNDLTWFIVMTVFNTAGILEIIYIFGFSGYGKKSKS